jgi:hypothetical protein
MIVGFVVVVLVVVVVPDVVVVVVVVVLLPQPDTSALTEANVQTNKLFFKFDFISIPLLKKFLPAPADIRSDGGHNSKGDASSKKREPAPGCL